MEEEATEVSLVSQTSVNCLDNEITAVREAGGTPVKQISI